MHLDYADRQLVVVRPDDEVMRAREATQLSQTTADRQPDPAGGAAGIVGAAHPLGLALNLVSRWRPSRAERRELSVLKVTRNKAKQLRFPVGHPLPDVVYVGNPAMPAVYYALADFHRQTFAHKFSEALTLLGSLGADTMSVTAVQGWSREFAANLGAMVPRWAATARPGPRRAAAGASSTATLQGSGDPRIPTDRTWFDHEHEWQGFARNRIDNDLREFTLHVRYEEDFSVDADLAAKVPKIGLKTGGSFQRHESTVWAISATFPPNQSRALRAIKHPFG